jgi:hypothetical protein
MNAAVGTIPRPTRISPVTLRGRGERGFTPNDYGGLVETGKPGRLWPAGCP